MVSSVVVRRPLQGSNRLLLYRLGVMINPVLESLDTTTRRLRLAFREGIIRSIQCSFPHGNIRDVFRNTGLSNQLTNSTPNGSNTALFSVNRVGSNVSCRGVKSDICS